MNVSVCIGTFGDPEWLVRAERALASVQEANEVIHKHLPQGTVSQARNAAAEQATGDWLCFLDADDELGASYLHWMRKAHGREPDPNLCLFTPALQKVTNGRPGPARFFTEVALDEANWIVIGTLVERSLFEKVGGFLDFGDPPGSNGFEDWALWGRCYREGARVVKVKRATYIAHVNMESRHRAADHLLRATWHYEIGSQLFPEKFPPEWLQRHHPEVRRNVRRRRGVREDHRTA